MKRDQSTTILSILIFTIAIILSGNVFAADATPLRVTQPEFDAAIATVNSKISNIALLVRAIGEVLPDNSIVFWVDETGQHGLAAQPIDDASGNWYVAKEMAENHGLGWRLPTKQELNLLFQQKDVVNNFFGEIYWSSTEYDGDNAWRQNITNNSQSGYAKNLSLSVRAVRAF